MSGHRHEESLCKFSGSTFTCIFILDFLVLVCTSSHIENSKGDWRRKLQIILKIPHSLCNCVLFVLFFLRISYFNKACDHTFMYSSDWWESIYLIHTTTCIYMPFCYTGIAWWGDSKRHAGRRQYVYMFKVPKESPSGKEVSYICSGFWCL